MINLGDRVKDSISGLSGVAVGITQYMYGCRHVCVRPEEVKDGKPIEGTWFDEPQLVVVDRAAIVRAGGDDNGGPSLHGYSRT